MFTIGEDMKELLVCIIPICSAILGFVLDAYFKVSIPPLYWIIGFLTGIVVMAILKSI